MPLKTAFCSYQPNLRCSSILGQMKASFASNKKQKWFAVLGCFRVYWHIKGEKLQENKKSIRKRSQLLNQVMGRHKGEGIGTLQAMMRRRRFFMWRLFSSLLLLRPLICHLRSIDCDGCHKLNEQNAEIEFRQKKVGDDRKFDALTAVCLVARICILRWRTRCP